MVEYVCVCMHKCMHVCVCACAGNHVFVSVSDSSTTKLYSFASSLCDNHSLCLLVHICTYTTMYVSVVIR